MPIRPFLNGEPFDVETLRILSVAFEQVCIGLRTGDYDDDVKQAIANKIIELAKTGERNSDLLCERALEDIRGDGLADWHKWALARTATRATGASRQRPKATATRALVDAVTLIAALRPTGSPASFHLPRPKQFSHASLGT